MIRHGLLTPLQDDVLHHFFASTTGFVLTGGAALAGFYTHHRTTTDLDLFTFDDQVFEQATSQLAAMAHQHAWTHQVRTSSPAFARVVIGRAEDAVVVDLVRDHSHQLGHEAVVIDGVHLDPLVQIFVNKLTALVGREEIRDVIDVMVLEHRGFVVEDHLDAALAKDGGCTAATLAWLLDGWSSKIPAGSVLGHDGATVVHYMRSLAQRMRIRSLP